MMQRIATLQAFEVSFQAHLSVSTERALQQSMAKAEATLQDAKTADCLFFGYAFMNSKFKPKDSYDFWPTTSTLLQPLYKYMLPPPPCTPVSCHL